MGDLSPHFDRAEFRCPCCNFDTVDAELLRILEVVRTHFDRPITVVSGCRCRSHNTAVGGSDNSQHLYGRAADIKVDGIMPSLVYELLDQMDVNGLGAYDSWVHLDTRSHEIARW